MPRLRNSKPNRRHRIKRIRRVRGEETSGEHPSSRNRRARGGAIGIDVPVPDVRLPNAQAVRISLCVRNIASATRGEQSGQQKKNGAQPGSPAQSLAASSESYAIQNGPYHGHHAEGLPTARAKQV